MGCSEVIYRKRKIMILVHEILSLYSFFFYVVELFFKFFSFNFVLDSSKDFDPSWQTDAQHGIKAKIKKG